MIVSVHVAVIGTLYDWYNARETVRRDCWRCREGRARRGKAIKGRVDDQWKVFLHLSRAYLV